MTDPEFSPDIPRFRFSHYADEPWGVRIANNGHSLKATFQVNNEGCFPQTKVNLVLFLKIEKVFFPLRSRYSSVFWGLTFLIIFWAEEEWEGTAQVFGNQKKSRKSFLPFRWPFEYCLFPRPPTCFGIVERKCTYPPTLIYHIPNKSGFFPTRKKGNI